jgi:hypothetical protein
MLKMLCRHGHYAKEPALAFRGEGRQRLVGGKRAGGGSGVNPHRIMEAWSDKGVTVAVGA